MKLFLLVLILVTSSCSFKKTNQAFSGHEELYSEPEETKLESLSSDEVRLVIAATNDLHGHYTPQKLIFQDQHNRDQQSTLVGGEAVMAGYFEILRQYYDRVLLVDSGDIFPAGGEFSQTQAFYEKLRYDAVTVGLRDFNLKVPAATGSSPALFQSFAKGSKTPLLLTNLYELKTARNVEWPGSKPYLLKDVKGVKVGILGLIPDDIVNLTPVNNRVGLFVENMLEATLKSARLLRSLGADVIVVLTNQSLDCHTKVIDSLKLPAARVNFDPLKDNVCEMRSILGEYLNRLPPELVDVVVGGRTKEKIANLVNGIVVISGYPDGQSFSYVELVLNKANQKLNREKTVIHQPVFFCHEFFKETNDCYTEDQSINHKPRIPATFLGEEIKPDRTSTAWMKPAAQKFDVARKLIEAQADISFHPESSGETQLFVIKVSGRDLLTLLEEEYNQGRAHLWQPSPFLMEKEEVRISIAGSEIQLNETYHVLSDLESFQRHHFFVKKVSSADAISFPTKSWDSVEVDTVTSTLASPAR